MYRQSAKNLVSSNISSTCPHNMVNFGPLAAEIFSLVWGTPGNFNGLRVLAALLHGTLVLGVSQTAALNRGRHLYSAGRPSRWALAHIPVLNSERFAVVQEAEVARSDLFCLWPPYGIGQAIIFLPCGFFFYLSSIFFFSSPNLSGRRVDVYHTSTHSVALVRI